MIFCNPQIIVYTPQEAETSGRRAVRNALGKNASESAVSLRHHSYIARQRNDQRGMCRNERQVRIEGFGQNSPHVSLAI